MKNSVLLHALIFFLVSVMISNAQNPTIRFKGKTIEVAKKDMEFDRNFAIESATFVEANVACQNLGSGWRLPTVNEFKVIRRKLYLKQNSNFKADVPYWCRSEDNAEDAWIFKFSNGYCQDVSYGTYEYHVFEFQHLRIRAVRTLH